VVHEWECNANCNFLRSELVESLRYAALTGEFPFWKTKEWAVNPQATL
jgi:hypothetical protein